MRDAAKRRLPIAALLALSLILSAGCSDCTEPPDSTERTTFAADDDSPIRAEGVWLIGESETMVYCFRRTDFTEAEAELLLADATALAEDICRWLKVDSADMVSTDGEKPICYFDSTYRWNGEIRSSTKVYERKMWCVTPEDYVHEYVHMVSGCSNRLIYMPDNLLREGLATYVGFTWQETLALGEYPSVPHTTVRLSTNDPSERAVIEQMLDASIEQTPLNIYRAEMAYACETYGIDRVLAIEQTNEEYFMYHVGCILIDYLMKQSGGRADVMALYFDAMQAESIYGASLDELIRSAVEDCMQAFQ